MRMAVLMGKKEKSGSLPEPAGKKKQNPGVKLSPQFHKKLKIVADDLDVDMGVLIEREMEEFVKRESKRVAGDLLSDG